MAEDVEALADVVDEYKQAKYHVSEFVNRLLTSDVDVESFRDEFVEDGPVDKKLMALVDERR